MLGVKDRNRLRIIKLHIKDKKSVLKGVRQGFNYMKFYERNHYKDAFWQKFNFGYYDNEDVISILIKEGWVKRRDFTYKGISIMMFIKDNILLKYSGGTYIMKILKWINF